MTRPSRSTALLALLRAHGVDADGAYDLRSALPGIPPGMLYSLNGHVFHLPYRDGRGYIAALVPKTPEAKAYINESRPVELPEAAYLSAPYHAIRRIRLALKKK